MHRRLFLLSLVVSILWTNILSSQWSKTLSTSGWVRSIAINGSLVFAGDYGGGVYLSTDQGKSWKVVTNGLLNPYVIALASQGNNILAGTSGGGVFLTSNQGTSWVAVNNGIGSNTSVITLAVGGTNIFAGTDTKGIFLSTNAGANWTSVNNGVTELNIGALATSGNVVWAGTNGRGLLVSTSNGGSWTSIGPANTWIHSIVLCGSSVFVGTRPYGGSNDGIFCSDNLGVTWTQRNNGLTNFWIEGMALRGSELFAGTDDGVFNSTDRGLSWVAVNTGLIDRNITSIAANDTLVFVGTKTGLYQRPLSDWVRLISPENNRCGIAVPTLFQWKSNPRALTYSFQISSTENFTNILASQYSTDSSIVISGLQPSTLYYWRVRAENLSWASDWGKRVFTTKLAGAPQLLTPVSGATFVSMSTILRWAPVVSTASYTIELSTDSLFKAVVFSRDTSSNSMSLPQLQYSTSYFWRVKAQVIGDTTAWSAVSKFTTVPSPPDKIVLVYPDSGKQDVYRNDWFVWRPDSMALAFHLQISQSPLFTTIVDSTTVGSVEYRNPKLALIAGSTYFWRVRGINMGGIGPFSSVWSFKVGTDFRPSPIVFCSSWKLEFDSVFVGQRRDTIMTLRNVGDDTLKISSIVSSNALFSAKPSVGKVLPGQSLVDTITFSPSSNGVVSGIMLVHSNSATSPDTLKVSGTGIGVPSAPRAVTISWSGNGVVIRFSMPQESPRWDGLKIERASGPTAPFVEVGSAPRNSYEFTDTTVVTTGPYRYRARAFNGAGHSAYSNDLFISVVTLIQSAEGATPKCYVLRQNFPDPFNPSTDIVYELPRASFVSLKVFSSLGQLVATLVSENKQPGYYQVRWNASHFPSGIYFYRLQTGDFVETKKMLLVK